MDPIVRDDHLSARRDQDASVLIVGDCVVGDGAAAALEAIDARLAGAAHNVAGNVRVCGGFDENSRAVVLRDNIVANGPLRRITIEYAGLRVVGDSVVADRRRRLLTLHHEAAAAVRRDVIFLNDGRGVHNVNARLAILPNLIFANAGRHAAPDQNARLLGVDDVCAGDLAAGAVQQHHAAESRADHGAVSDAGARVGPFGDEAVADSGGEAAPLEAPLPAAFNNNSGDPCAVDGRWNLGAVVANV